MPQSSIVSPAVFNPRSPWHYPQARVHWFKRKRDPAGKIEDEVTYTDYLPLRPHLTPLAEKVFVNGQCHALAVALHEILGWPIFGEFDSYGYEGKETYHYVIQCPGNNGYSYADVTGIHCVDCGHRKTTAKAILANRRSNMLPPAMEYARHYAPLVIKKLKREDKIFANRYGRVRCIFPEGL